MSIFGVITNKAYGYEDAFGATDCTSTPMKQAIQDWFNLFYQSEKTNDEDPCQRIPYTVVNKIAKTVFGEYTAESRDEYAKRLLKALNRIRQNAMQSALIGGVSYIKPFPLGERFTFTNVPRSNILIFGKDVDGNPVDVGTAEQTTVGSSYYTLLERRTIGRDGLLTIRNKLYKSDTAETLGRPVPLNSIPRYEAFKEEYTFQEPVGLGMVPLRSPGPNCVDGSTDPVSVYAAAVGLIHNINHNQAELNGEFSRGKSRLIVSSDMLQRRIVTENGKTVVKKGLDDDVFVGLDDDPEHVGITMISQPFRDQSFLAVDTTLLRKVENTIGLKRGLLSDVEEVERTATEITSSAGDYNLTIIDFQRMWETAVKETLTLCGTLGRLYRVAGAHDLKEDAVTIDWGNGVLYDESKTWEEYKAMVAAGMLRPEIAVGWYFNQPTETLADLEKIRARYMPEIESLMEAVE